MTSRPKKRRRVVLTDYKAKKNDDAIEIETADGKVYTIPSPMLWPDEVAIAAAGGPEAQVNAARALIGEEYDDFVASGGSSSIVWGIVADEYGADLPESSGSSTS